MFSGGPKYQKLTTNLRLAINRLKLLEKKKTELTVKARREIADYLAAGKEDRARIRVEHSIREDYIVEAMEIVEMYCDLLLARMGLIQSTKELDSGLEEPISSIIWATPRLQSEVQELVIVSEQLALKYGKEFAQSCRANALNTVNEKLLHKLSVQAPPRQLVERYLVEIAKSYNVSYLSPPDIGTDGDDAVNLLLIDPPYNPNDNKNSGSGSGGGGGGFTAPVQPFQYPAAAAMPSVPPYQNCMPQFPVPAPRQPSAQNALPDLPAVPTNGFDTVRSGGPPADDVNFDDLTKRFEELKKRK